jgi:tripartite-type tricarboxylate transporter receptor subunit TctC
MEISTRRQAVRSFTRPARLTAALLLAGAAQARWQPDRPITVIVPWAAGGSTDQVTRVTAAELEKALNQ